MSERSGIEIDYCPKCRGVWLDRGELDKIIERNSQEATSFGTDRLRGDRNADSSSGRGDTRPYDEDDYRYVSDDRSDDYDRRKRKKRRGGFMEDLFDFGD